VSSELRLLKPESAFHSSLFAIRFSFFTIHSSLFRLPSSFFTLHSSPFPLPSSPSAFHSSLFTIHYSSTPTRAYGLAPHACEEWFLAIATSVLSTDSPPFLTHHACRGLARQLARAYRVYMGVNLAENIAVAVERWVGPNLDIRLARKLVEAIEEQVNPAGGVDR